MEVLRVERGREFEDCTYVNGKEISATTAKDYFCMIHTLYKCIGG